MSNLIKKFFSKRKPNDSFNQSEQLSSDIHIATCALFLEMANIDGEFSALERSIDLWKFTNRINQKYSMEEKIRVVETVWDVVYADGKLDKHENYLVHKLANLLHLSHKQLIDAKLKVKRSRPDQ